MKRIASIARLGIAMSLIVSAIACEKPLITHKLVSTGNEHSVPMYTDEGQYLKVSRMKQQGGVEGMVGNVGKQFESKDIDDQTPVKIVSSDSNGSVVQIVSGPMSGDTGFVAKQNVD